MVFGEYEGIGFVYCVQFDSQLLIVNEYKNKSAIDKKSLDFKAFPVDLEPPAWIWKGLSY